MKIIYSLLLALSVNLSAAQESEKKDKSEFGALFDKHENFHLVYKMYSLAGELPEELQRYKIPDRWYVITKIGDKFRATSFHDEARTKLFEFCAHDGELYYYQMDSFFFSEKDTSKLSKYYGSIFSVSPLNYLIHTDPYVKEDLTTIKDFGNIQMHTIDGHMKYSVKVEKYESYSPYELFKKLSVRSYRGEDFKKHNKISDFGVELLEFKIIKHEMAAMFDKTYFMPDDSTVKGR